MSRVSPTFVSLAGLMWALVLFAGFYNLSNFPTIWWDEAIFSETAANLAQKGRYAFTMQSPEVLNDFDYRISAGPVLIVPVALAYKLLGVSVWSGRLVAGGFFVLAFILLYFCARRLLPRGPALLAVFLGLVSTDVLYWGRSVLGDVPALACFLGGLSLVLRGWQECRSADFFLAGLCLGLATGAKEFYGFTLVLALIFVVWEARSDRRHLVLRSALLILGAALPLGFYVLAKAAVLGGLWIALAHFYFQKKLLCHEFFTPLTIGRLYPESLAYLLTHPCFLGGLLGLWLYRRRQGASLAWGFWAANSVAWSVFYLLAVYWHRFALPALFLACPWAAYLLVSLAESLYRTTAPHRYGQLFQASILLLVMTLLHPFASLYHLEPLVSRTTDSPFKLVQYLQQQVPTDFLIETPEYELIFLDDEHSFHLMPEFYFVESTAEKTVLCNPAQCFYDFTRVKAEILILGSFGKSVFRQNYPEQLVKRFYRKITSVDFYDVYLRRDLSLDQLVKVSTPPPLCPTPQN